MNRDKIISEYLEEIKKRYNVLGSFICGSYVSGEYNEESDLDIFILVDDHEFDMILEMYEGVLFDRIIVDYDKIIKIIESKTPIGNILSYSFGSNNKVIEASSELSELLKVSKQNISKYGLTYIKSPNKPKKITDGSHFSIIEDETGFILMKQGKKII